ncbi:hypothetical protein [Corynebacterium pilosum]|uniref:AlwI restriction endonuclease n=1 Tax=Corynebacterium pilosum TaxID=35756 RepID=A0A376CNJ5_9CORY|nr:hypothetical protein [Corynebacterium pilosum]STC69787.1 AlwI restriction endonuclease [Corynebacterium pilosum]
MATIDKRTKTLFFITSPRTPLRMIPEIELLVTRFTGADWDNKTQKAFMNVLVQTEHFQSANKNPRDPAFSARDRINRAPKALGFVNLDPVQLTDAGKELLSGQLEHEALLRQMLKFQLPSPYHKKNSNSRVVFGSNHILKF